MQAAAGKHLIPFLRRLGSDGAPLRKHMSSASYEIPTDRPLAEVVDLVSDLPMKSRDTKGYHYEYMLLKVTSAGQNGQFRKPRHIINAHRHPQMPVVHPQLGRRWAARDR